MNRLCGADTLVREKLKAKANQKKGNAVRAEIVRTCAVFLATLREIFDESAYARFLTRRNVQSSPEAYGDFLRESEAARARRPKCC